MTSNPYQDDFDRASEHLRIALSLLSRNKVPPSPMNFRIGYDCVAGANEQLKNDFVTLTAKPGNLSSDNLWELYRKHYVQDEKALETMREELRHIIVSIRSEFERSGGNLAGYTNTLGRFVDILDDSPSPEEISLEVNKVIDETRTMEKSSKRLETQVQDMLNDVEALRKELAQVKEESITDSLTGIANRKAFDATLEHAIYDSREHKTPLCLLLADIDHFKQFNDTYGHLVGDKVLRFVAATLKRCVKGNDIAARFGGEEFAVILPQTELPGAETVAEQIRRAVSSGQLKDKASGEAYGKITISVGIAQFFGSDLPNDLIHRADKALYLAKERGRNRIEKAA